MVHSIFQVLLEEWLWLKRWITARDFSLCFFLCSNQLVFSGGSWEAEGLSRCLYALSIHDKYVLLLSTRVWLRSRELDRVSSGNCDLKINIQFLNNLACAITHSHSSAFSTVFSTNTDWLLVQWSEHRQRKCFSTNVFARCSVSAWLVVVVMAWR